MSFMFQCTTSTYYGNDTLPCGSKKKDMLLTFWIAKSSITNPVSPALGPEAMDHLRVCYFIHLLTLTFTLLKFLNGLIHIPFWCCPLSINGKSI